MPSTLSAATIGVTPETVTFPSGDGTIVAHLYLPAGYDAAKRYPAVAIGGSFSSVKEQMGGIYGGELAKRDVIGLAIDYRNYGERTGTIRQYENPVSKAEDMASALRYLRSRPDVSGAGLLGVCTSATAVLMAAAEDPTIGAVATVAGTYVVPSMWGNLDRRRDAARKAKKKYDETGVVDTVAAYSPINPSAVNTVPMPYYLSPKRGNVPEWTNEFAVMAWADMIQADALAAAAKVTSPTLVVHAQFAAFPKLARQVHENLAGPKELHWTSGSHFNFYDQPAKVHETADKLAAHFTAKLS